MKFSRKEMGSRLKPHEVKIRQQQKETLLVAIRQHPDGVTTAFLVEATGINKNLAMRLLTRMAMDGLIGQVFRLRKGDGNRVAHWLPDPGLGRQINPYLSRRRKGSMAPHFKPYEDADAEQVEWNRQVQQRATQKFKFNPWGQA